MKINEIGVNPDSEAYFHTATVTAKSMFFYLCCTGRYTCNGNYAVHRQAFDSFLILYVQRGNGYCYLNNQRVELCEGAFVIVDCYQPHRYGTDTGWEILWIHFDGVMARKYYDMIVQSKRQIIIPKNAYNASRGLERIYNMYHQEKRTSEALTSKHITTMLTEFLIYDPQQDTRQEYTVRIEEILSYINENIHQPLTLDSLAQRAGLSPFHFSRVFKKEIGYTLREYLVNTRINTAKFYLRTTPFSLKEISYRCGYSSDSTFCSTFKRETGLTPLEYRNLRNDSI